MPPVMIPAELPHVSADQVTHLSLLPVSVDQPSVFKWAGNFAYMVFGDNGLYILMFLLLTHPSLQVDTIPQRWLKIFLPWGTWYLLQIVLEVCRLLT